MHTYGFRDQAFYSRKDWALGIGLIEDLVALRPAYKQAQTGQVFQFPLQGAMSSADFTGKLAQIKRLVDMTIKQS